MRFQSSAAVVPLVEGVLVIDIDTNPVNAKCLVDFPDTLGRLLLQDQREDHHSDFQHRTDVFYSHV